ncbi:GDSL-type esterase/lipase family protein [Kitasatospora gansuensis]
MRTAATRGAALLTGALLTLAAAVGGSVPAVAAPLPAAALAPPTGPTVAVALGDSFISGEGGRWLGNSARYQTDRNGTDRAWTGSGYDPSRVYGSTAAVEGCHRSDVSELATAALPVAERVNLACSGAETRHVLSTAAGGEQLNGEAPQLDRLGQIARTKRVSLVVLSLGGNDIGFGGIIGECAYDWAFSRLCSREQGAIVDRKLPQVRAAISAVVDDLRATMTAAGYRTGDYRLVLQSYPSPIPGGEEFRLREGDSNRLNRDGCPFNNRDADWARYTLVPQLSELVGSVAAAKGADFLDLQDMLVPRGLLARHRPGRPGRARPPQARVGALPGLRQHPGHPGGVHAPQRVRPAGARHLPGPDHRPPRPVELRLRLSRGRHPDRDAAGPHHRVSRRAVTRRPVMSSWA